MCNNLKQPCKTPKISKINMKKLIITLALAAVGVSAFAQGEFAFNGPGGRGVWLGTNGSASIFANANVDVAFLFGSTANTPEIAGIAANTATNGTTVFNTSTAWTDILTDPNFMLATNDNGGSPILAVGTEGSNGAYGYTPPGGAQGGAFAVDGSASGGATYRVYVIGWSSAFATPQLAAAAGAAVGWSQYFSYAAQAGPNPGPAGSPGTMLAAAGNATVLQFGVEVAPSPEPTTVALAGLGGLALLGLRRRK
jgi:MYXO-CTERM domain-containing protein